MTDGFDVVAVGVADKGPEVVRVVLGPHLGGVQHLGTGGHGGLEEGHHGIPVPSREGQMGLTEPLPGGAGPEPEVGSGRYAEADGRAVLEQAIPPSGRSTAS